MRFSVRALILSLCLSLFAALFVPSAVQAQSSYPVSTGTNTFDTDVPATQHVRVQSLLIDVLSAIICQLGGIDPVDPKRGCLEVDPISKQLGYNTSRVDENGNPRSGGLLGASAYMIGMLYTPSVSSRDYTQYIANNFGIVKPAYAQPTTHPASGYGFNALNPLLSLWTAVRNVAYFLLMLAFVIIGLGIMLRVKVDPRTVMSLQNQIPKIIVCILLVTFSYGIAGVLADIMWITTYVGINIITSAGGTDPAALGNTNTLYNTDQPLSKLATDNLLQDPFGFVNAVFRNNGSNLGGIGTLTWDISFGLGAFLEQIVRGFFGVTANDSCASLTGGLNFAACMAGVFGFIASLLLLIIILIVLLRVLFQVWFTLLKAYTYVILYSIGSPLFIILGLVPNQKAFGFEKWVRSMAANLGVFPATVFVFMLARLFMQLFQTSTPDQFIPPLVFQPNLGIWGVMLAFGMFMMTPTLLTVLQEAFKATGSKYGSAIGQGLAAGAAAPKAAFGTVWNQATRKSKLHEHDAGWLRQWAAGRYAPNPNAKGFGGWVVNTIRKGRNKLNKVDMRGNPVSRGH